MRLDLPGGSRLAKLHGIINLSPMLHKQTLTVLRRMGVMFSAMLGITLLESCSLQKQFGQVDAGILQELRREGIVNSAQEVNTKRLPGGATLLIDAAEKGDYRLVTKLLAVGADPNGRGYSINAVPLTRTQSPEVVRALVEARGEVNVCDDTGTTPLSRSLGTGNVKGAEFLLSKGAELKPGAPAEPPLLAVNNVQVAEWLVKAGADVNQASAKGVTPLMRAVARNNEPLVEYYIACGADVKAVDALGNTALHVARSASVVNRLVRAGAEPQALNVAGETPLFDILHTAPLVKALVEAGVPLDVISKSSGMTALLAMLSDPREDDAAILVLIRAGADVQVRTPRGESALQLAQRRKSKRRVAIIRALIQRGAQ